MRQRAASRALPERRKFHQIGHGARLGGGADVGGDDAHRPAVQHAADIIGRVRGHAHQRRHADLLGADADMAACADRQGVVLQIDIQRVKTAGFRDLGDLDGPRETHGHGGNDLIPGQFFFHVVAQDARNFGHGPLPLFGGTQRRDKTRGAQVCMVFAGKTSTPGRAQRP